MLYVACVISDIGIDISIELVWSIATKDVCNYVDCIAINCKGVRTYKHVL